MCVRENVRGWGQGRSGGANLDVGIDDVVGAHAAVPHLAARRHALPRHVTNHGFRRRRRRRLCLQTLLEPFALGAIRSWSHSFATVRHGLQKLSRVALGVGGGADLHGLDQVLEVGVEALLCAEGDRVTLHETRRMRPGAGRAEGGGVPESRRLARGPTATPSRLRGPAGLSMGEAAGRSGGVQLP